MPTSLQNNFFIVILLYIDIQMGITKTDIYTEEQNQIAAIAKALGHPARIAILDEIIKKDSCICGDLVNEIGLAQPTVSQHLKALKAVGLIKGTIEGTSVCYCIDMENWAQFKHYFIKLFDFNTSSKCC